MCVYACDVTKDLNYTIAFAGDPVQTKKKYEKARKKRKVEVKKNKTLQTKLI